MNDLKNDPHLTIWPLVQRLPYALGAGITAALAFAYVSSWLGFLFLCLCISIMELGHRKYTSLRANYYNRKKSAVTPR